MDRRDRERRHKSRERRKSRSRERHRSRSRDRHRSRSRDRRRSRERYREKRRSRSRERKRERSRDLYERDRPRERPRFEPPPVHRTVESEQLLIEKNIPLEKRELTEQEEEEEKKRQRKERLALWKQQKATAENKLETPEIATPSIETQVENIAPPEEVIPVKQPAKAKPFLLKKINLPTKRTEQSRIMFDTADDNEINQIQKKKISKISFDDIGNEKQEKKVIVEEDDPLDSYMGDVQIEVKRLVDEVKLIEPETTLEILNQVDREEETKTALQEFMELDDPDDILAAATKRLGAKKKDLLDVDHSQIDYILFRKEFWIEPEDVRDMTPEEIDLKRAELDNVRIRGISCPKPIDNWAQMGLTQSVFEVIKKVLKYEKPSPIQAQAIPAVMSGRDVIGIAKTGSGKTIAFLLPLFRQIMDQPPLQNGEGPMALVMTPTRELALQIYRDCKNFTKKLGIRVVCAYGGAQIRDQIAELKRGAEIIICTPGRMIDLLTANSGRVTNLQRVTYLVLDEADRMFDLGFEPQVMKIVNNCRPDRQTVMFSATFPRSMEALARKILKKPLEITVGGRSVVCQDVEQHVEVVDEDNKFNRLLEILGFAMEDDPDTKVLIFVDRHESADNMLRDLLRRGYPCLSLHGGKDQADRDSNIMDFKSGATNILIATSVAARGLDVKQLKMVVNYDCPNHMEDYVHRVGRTGRAGNKGVSYTFITPQQERFSIDILKALKMSGAGVPPELAKMSNEFIAKVKAGGAKFHGSGFGGKGLERLEAERDAVKKIQQQTIAGDLYEGEFDEEEGGAENKDSIEAKFEAKVVSVVPTEEDGKTSSTLKDPVSGSRQLTGVERARQIAMGLSTINNKSAITSNKTAAVAYEIEINDFPQKARWRVTNKEQIQSITEMTGAAITTRGNFFPPGRIPKAGERKLFLYIEGDSQEVIEKAKNEIKRALFESTVESIEGGEISSVAMGRYSVL